MAQIRNNLIPLIKESKERATTALGEYQLGNTFVFVKDPLPEGFDMPYVLGKIKNILPVDFTDLIDSLYIGMFEEFIERQTNAYYEDGAIYVTNEQDDEDDMIDDIVHEMAHALEEVRGGEIYGDDKVELEFLGKRKRLYNTLLAQYDDSVIKMAKHFTNINYSIQFDDYLYKAIGYPMLTSLTMGLFNSPYGITSIREYFANGLEEYFLGDRKRLQKISPQLFNKIEQLVQGLG